MVLNSVSRKLAPESEIQLIRQRFKESSATLAVASLNEQLIVKVARVAQTVAASLKRGGRVLIFGNGGSAADAQHFAAELIGGYTNHHRPPMDVIALSTNTSNLTAIGNDYRYEEVFSRQVEAHAKKGDVAIGISTSGNSANVLEGMKAARKKSAFTVAFTGASGGKLSRLAEIVIHAPSNVTGRIQEVHITAIHSICELVEQALYPSKNHQ